MKRGLKLHWEGNIPPGYIQVRTQAPMKRGLKLNRDIRPQQSGKGPNPGPDEEGIETSTLRWDTTLLM